MLPPQIVDRPGRVIDGEMLFYRTRQENSTHELDDIVDRALATSAQIAKVATQVNRWADNRRLLDLLRRPNSKPLIIAGMVLCFAKALGESSRGLAIAQVMPFPWSQVDVDVAQYQKALAAAKQEPSYYSLEGWINAQVMIEAIKRTGRDLTRGKLLAAMRSLRMRIAGLGGQEAALEVGGLGRAVGADAWGPALIAVSSIGSATRAPPSSRRSCRGSRAIAA